MKRISHYKFYMLALCFFMGSITVIAQSEHTDWSAESYLVAINETDVEITSNLSKQDATFTWEQVGYNNAIDTTAFAITTVTGNWNTQDNLGTLSYELSSDALSANLTVTGTTEGITLVLTINHPNSSTSDSYAFYIDTFTNL